MNPPYNGPKVAIIGLDGVDPERLRQYVAEGRLPAIAGVIGRGRAVSLDGEGEMFVRSVWPCAASGQTVGHHGLHAFRPLKSGTVRTLETKDIRLPEPFWEIAARAGVATTVLDFPFYSPTPADPAVEHLTLVEWGPHPPIRGVGASNEVLRARLLSRHGEHPCTADDETVDGVEQLAGIGARINAGARIRGAVAVDLIEWTRPDLFVAVFPEIHVAAHQFMNREDPGHRCYDPALVARLGSPTLATYEAVDRAVGEILARLPGDATVLLSCLLGLRPTYGGGLLLNDLLVRLGVTASTRLRQTQSHLSRLARLLPARVQSALRGTRAAILPPQLDLGLDWSRTRAFALRWSPAGYLRVNLRGREPFGIVEPGAERDALLAEIEALVGGLRIAGTDEPAARIILRTQDQFPGAANAELPDLMVLWKNDRPLDAVESPAVGRLENRDQTARTAHGGAGRMFAYGPLIAAGAPIEHSRDIDLAPTILELVGVSPPDSIDGRAVTELIAVHRRP